MKKILVSAAALAIVSVPMSSFAGDSVYLKGNVGIGMAMDADIDNMPENAGTAKMTFDSGFLGTAALGYDFAGPFRTEVEYGWQKNDIDTLSYSNRIGNINQGDLKTQSIMLNGYYDVDTGSPWSPFVGAGIGWAKVDLNTPALPFGDNDDVFAYQLMAGVSYNFSDQLALDAQYRFFDTQDATIQGADFSTTSNDLMLGIRYTF
jgi:opacity protein-like surface antigen